MARESAKECGSLVMATGRSSSLIVNAKTKIQGLDIIVRGVASEDIRL